MLFTREAVWERLLAVSLNVTPPLVALATMTYLAEIVASLNHPESLCALALMVAFFSSRAQLRLSWWGVAAVNGAKPATRQSGGASR